MRTLYDYIYTNYPILFFFVKILEGVVLDEASLLVDKNQQNTLKGIRSSLYSRLCEPIVHYPLHIL